MKATFSAALALLALLTAPAAAVSDTNTNKPDVSYIDAMDCSAVYSILSTSSEGRSSAAYEELAARWLVIAMRRDGTTDGRRADADLIPLIEDIIETFDQVPEAGAIDRFIDDMIGFCETKEELIADEFERIKLNEPVPR